MPAGNRMAFKPGGTPDPLTPKMSNIPEPVHRMAAEGAGTGISVREQPSSCVDEVRKICLHYVSKCSGKYVDSKLAGRYVHQMAEEVMSQLKGVAAQIRAQESNPEILQELLDEWNDQFPPSLGNLGTPKHIASALTRQSTELNNLQQELDVEKSKREKDVSSVLRSMDAQLHASSESVMTERRQQGLTHQHQLNQLKAQLKETRRKHRHEVKATAKKNANDIATMQHRYVTQIKALNEELETTKNYAQSTIEGLTIKYESLENSSREREKQLKEKLKKLANQVSHSGRHHGSSSKKPPSLSRKTLTGGVPGGPPGSVAAGTNNEDGISAVSSEFGSAISAMSTATPSIKTIDEAGAIAEEEEKDMDDDVSDMSSVVSIPIITSAGKDEDQKRLSVVARQKAIRVKGSAALAGMKVLKRALKNQIAVTYVADKEIEKLKKQITAYSSDVTYQKSRADGLEQVNESLRRALENVDTAGFSGKEIADSRTLKFNPNPLKHNPHFLGGY